MSFIGKSVITMTIILISLGFGVSLHLSAANTDQADRHLSPPVDIDEKYRVGYIEGEPFVNFAGTLNGIINGLAMLDWANDTSTVPYVSGQEDSQIIWQSLNSNNKSDYIEFVEDAYYSLRSMTDPEIDEMVERLKEAQDLDLVIVMGTRAGKLMADSDHHIPFMTFSVTDALTAGIVDSAEDSGSDHIWAHLDPDRTKRQVNVFHDIFEFNSMGIVYENSHSGRSTTGIQDILEISSERGIDVHERHVDLPVDNEDLERYYQDILEAHESLATDVDAMYVTYGDWEIDHFIELIQPLMDNNLPIFSQTGAEEVNSGALISVSRADFNSWGQFGAENIIRALSGSSMRELPQVLEDTPGIALNLETAERIGYQIPFDILLVADDIYQNIGEENGEQ